MCDLFRLPFGLVVDLFRSRAAREAEVLVLRQQIVLLYCAGDDGERVAGLRIQVADSTQDDPICDKQGQASDCFGAGSPDAAVRGSVTSSGGGDGQWLVMRLIMTKILRQREAG